MDPAVRQSGGRTNEAADLYLDSWKEIASYLRRDIRTVQLWEKSEGLPIHRHTHNSRASVYAYAREIDAWKRKRGQEIGVEAPVPEAEEETIAHLVVPAVTHTDISRPTGRWPIFLVTGAVVLVAVVGILYWKYTYQPRKMAQQVVLQQAPRLAILPFEDLSANAEGGRLADGLTENITTEFVRSGRIHVVSRRSVSQFKERRAPLQQIASTLRADYILEGTVVASGNRVRITTQLIDAANDQHLWAERYIRNSDDLLALQDEIATSVSKAVLEKLATRLQASDAQRAKVR
jgi:TolB-like protein